MSTLLRRSVSAALATFVLTGAPSAGFASGIDASVTMRAPSVKRETPAGEGAAPTKTKAAAASAPAASASASTAAIAPAASVAASKVAPKPRAIQDPMDVIRERLAEKLGSVKAAEPAGANVLRVVSKTPAEGSERRAALPSTEGGGSPSAARLAAAHRAGRAAAPVKAGSLHDEHSAPWEYQGAGGPETWGQLKPEFSKCSTGTRQSPIDIRDGIKVQLDPVQFSYRPSGFNVVDNGHTVQVDVGAGNSIEVMGRRFELVEFHFHRPSEERIDGRQFDMVVHLVHKDIDGKIAIVAVLLDRGSAHPIVQSVWNNLPLEKGDTVTARNALDLEALLPKDRRYFTYMGSLTTPPCSEGVLWMVMKEPVAISSEQIGIFSRLYPMNARPIQQMAGRLIKESN